MTDQHKIYLLALSMGLVAVCGIIYQLVVGTVSTYLAGNSTLQYSVTIGLFMSSYGVGSFASSSVQKRLLEIFVLSELVIGLFGGTAAFALFYLYGHSDFFQAGRVLWILIIGALIGLEVPILIRLTENLRKNLSWTVGQMMGFDYIGALVGGLLFPLCFLPLLGLMGTSFAVGLLNVFAAAIVLWAFRSTIGGAKILWFGVVIVGVLLVVSMSSVERLEQLAEESFYEDRIVYSEQTPYQRIVVTKHRDDMRLYLDGSLQFSSRDEYRYHESLVHVPARRVEKLRRVLVLGGGDGLALKHLLSYVTIEQVDLIDLDPGMTHLGASFPPFVALNQEAFQNLPLTVLNQDAFSFVAAHAQQKQTPYDLIIVDLPDPHHESLAKLYSTAFYSYLKQIISPQGVIGLQLGSPFFANRSYWANIKTLESVGLGVKPYHVNVPSFGEWGFALAFTKSQIQALKPVPKGQFLTEPLESSLFIFPPDLGPQHEVEITTLTRPRIVDYFNTDWRSWN